MMNIAFCEIKETAFYNIAIKKMNKIKKKKSFTLMNALICWELC